MKVVTDFFNKLLKEIDAKYFPDVKYYRDNVDDAKVHRTTELYSNGCLTYGELICRLAKDCKDTKENIHQIVSQYIEDFEGYKYDSSKAFDPINATFVSVWDGDTEVEAGCLFNPETDEATEIESTDDVEDLKILFEQYIRLPNGETVTTFNYDGISVVDGQQQDEE